MNKNLFIILMSLAILVGLLPSCHGGGAPRYDARLVLADSVLRSNDPDSALQLLTTIDGAKLPSAGDRAYHALLLTQAQYRCYVDITSDSTINVALDYYKRHKGEQEKLTRSYIYKGAVTEVQGDPERAITFYKKAIDLAAPDDHSNQGYANLRIGCLYRDYLVADSAAITAIKEALHHFEQVPDSLYIMKCLSSIGGVYAAKDKRDSAIFYLDRADTFSKKLHQSSEELVNLMYLADLKMFSNDIDELEEAKAISLRLLRNGDIVPERRDHLLMDAANTLAKLNKPDSAVFYINQVDRAKQKDGLLVLYESCLAEIARSRQDVDQFKLYCGDTGLFVTLAFWDDAFTENVIYQKLLSDKLNADVGYVYENVISQMLVAGRHKLYYHTWPTPSGKHNYEIDFLLSRQAKVCPIEVKSSTSNVHTSIDEFQKKFSSRIYQRYLLHAKDMRKEQNLLCLPLYMALFL